MNNTKETVEKEQKIAGPIYGIYGSLRNGSPKDFKSQLKFPLKYFDGKLKEDLKSKIGFDETKYLNDTLIDSFNLFDRFLTKNEGDGKMTEIHKFFKEYNIKVSKDELIFTSIFEATCKMAFFEFINTNYPYTDFSLKMKRTIEYNLYKKNNNDKEEEIFDNIGLTIFGEDNGDY